MRPLDDGAAPVNGPASACRGLGLLGLLAALAFLSACTLWLRPDPLGQGQRLYSNLCSSSACHGKEGDREGAVRLFSKQFLEGQTDDRLVRAISEGNAIMLPFSKARGGPLSAEDIQDIVSYLRSRAGALTEARPAKGAATATPPAEPSARPPSGGGIPTGGLASSSNYAKYCLPCHGEKGLGVASAPLGYRDFVAGLGQEGLARAISQGKGAMPPWGKARGGPLSEPEIAGLAAYILSSASSTPPPTVAAPVAKGAATPTATPPPIGTPAPAAAPGPPGKALYDQFCTGCHPIAAAIAPNANRAAAMRYAPGLTEGQADIILDYLRAPMAAEVPGGPAPGATQAPPAKATGGPPPAIPHSLEGRERKCLECHGWGAMAPFPVGHKGRTVETCLLCHEASPRPAPPMAHGLGDRAGRCMICHGSGGSVSRVPASHAGRGTQTCTFCH